MAAITYHKSNRFPPFSFLDTASINPTRLTKNKNWPPMEFMMLFIEPSFSSATVVRTLGHKVVVMTGDLMEGKLKGPKKLFLNCSQPEKRVVNIAVDKK